MRLSCLYFSMSTGCTAKVGHRRAYMIVYEEGHGIDIKQQLIGHYVTVSRYRTRYTQAP